MDLEPKKFFIGVIDFFSVLLPGALLSYALLSDPTVQAFGEPHSEAAGWIAFIFASYILGHFIFLVGAAFLDDFFYEPIREATPHKQIGRLAKGELPSPALLRLLARWLIKKDSDAAQECVIKIKDQNTKRLGPIGINAFHWSKSRLVLENHAEAVETVQRYEADSKFFRSFTVVIPLLMLLSIYEMLQSIYEFNFVAAGVAILFLSLFLCLSLWRYVDQRLKSVNQAYWYILTLEAAAADGYRGAQSRPTPSRAGGVVHRPTKRGGAEYLIVNAKDAPTEWVLPKGHVEPGEQTTETAVREVHEEAGVWARIERDLDMSTYESKGEMVEVRFFLTEAVAEDKPLEPRTIKWLAIDDAVKTVSHEESRRLLRLADERHRSSD